MALALGMRRNEPGHRIEGENGAANDLFSVAQDLEQRGQLDGAAQLYAGLGTSEARAHLEALSGSGGLTSERIEFLAGQFTDTVTDPAAIAAMAVAGGTYRALSPSLGSLAAFSIEAPAFTLAQRLGDASLGREVDWSREALARDIQSSFLILGGT